MAMDLDKAMRGEECLDVEINSRVSASLAKINECVAPELNKTSTETSSYREFRVTILGVPSTSSFVIAWTLPPGIQVGGLGGLDWP